MSTKPTSLMLRCTALRIPVFPWGKGEHIIERFTAKPDAYQCISIVFAESLKRLLLGGDFKTLQDIIRTQEDTHRTELTSQQLHCPSLWEFQGARNDSRTVKDKLFLLSPVFRSFHLLVGDAERSVFINSNIFRALPMVFSIEKLICPDVSIR